ncbi:hypothetical protein YC2023_070736 [Brassica napus]
MLPLHQSSYLRYAHSRGLWFDADECSAAEVLLLRWSPHLFVASASGMRGCLSPSASGRIRVASLGQRRFATTSPGSRSARDQVSWFSLFHRARVLFILVWCVSVDPSTTAAGCGFESVWCSSSVAGSRFKGCSMSMPSQWPHASSPHLEPLLRGS